MRKFIKNICALSLCGLMLMSGCAVSDSIEGEKADFSYPEDYEAAAPATEAVIVENEADFTGNVGDVTIESGDVYAVVKVQGYGNITIKLFPEAAPYAVQNFIDLAQSGYFDGKSIHRVISNFMIQGGSLNGDGTGGTDSNGGSFKNEINPMMRHFYGALCYASAMGDNTCQFYIVNNKEAVEDASVQYEAYIEYYNSMAQQYEGLRADYEEGSQEHEIIDVYVNYYLDSVEGIEAMLEATDDAVNEKYLSGGVPYLDGGYTVFGQTVYGFDVIDEISAVETEAGADGAASKPVKDIIIKEVEIMTVK